MKELDRSCNVFCLQMFERETRREKILEARHREMKLKERTKSSQDKVSMVKEIGKILNIWLDTEFWKKK